MPTATIATQDLANADEDLNNFIGYNLKRVYSLLNADLIRVLAEFGLRAVTFSTLSVVVARPGLNQTQLASILVIERSNLVQIIDDLATRKLIERAPVAGDRRRHALLPTSEGQALLSRAQKVVVDHEERMFASLHAEERATLLNLLQKIRSID